MLGFRKITFLLILFAAANGCLAQTIQSSGSGSGLWSDPLSWSPNIVPTSSNSSAIIINNGHAIQVNGDFTVDQFTIAGSLQINASQVLTVLDGSGTDLTITTGSLQVSGTIQGGNGWTFVGMNAGNTAFLSGSSYRHFYKTIEGAIPIASWNPASTVEIVGYTSPITATPGGNWGQTFGNFVYNCASQSYYSDTDFAGQLTSIAGSLTISRLGGGSTQGRIYFFNGQSGTLTVGGNVLVDIARVQFSTSGNVNLVFGGNFTFNASNSAGSFFNGSGALTANISGSFQVNTAASGKLSMGGALIRVGGNWDVTGGSFFGPGTLQFNGVFNGITPQTFSLTGTMGGTINYIVDATSALSILGESSLEGNGAFTLSGTLILGSTEPMGALVANITSGNVQTPIATRTFNNGSVIIYGGLSPQFIGTGHPSASNVSTVINNTLGVTLANTVTVGGNLELRLGSLNVGGQILNLNSTASGIGTIVTTSSSNVNVTGTGNVTIPFAPNSILRSLTVNRIGFIASINTRVTINNSLSLANGDLDFSNQELILNGTANLLSVASGRFRCNSSSTLTINGSGNLGSAIRFQPAANQLGTLTINRTPSGSISLGNAVTIINNFNLQNGIFSNPGFLTMANLSNLSRSSGSQITGSAPSVSGGNRYNLFYPSGGVNSGLEMPSSATALNNLTINGGGLTLQQAITINGNFLLTSGSMTTGNFNVTMNGNSWTQNGGTYGPGLGIGTTTFTGNSVIAGTTAVTFGNLQFNAASSIIMPTVLSTTNHFTILPGATLNTNNGTVLFNGSGNQNLSGGGATLLNVTVNKAGGTLSLNSAVNLLGIMLVQSASTVNANGNLTLLSLSDGPTNNGSIGPLALGASISGNVTLQRYMSDEGVINRYISFPLNSISVSQLQDDYSVTGNFTGTSYPCNGCLNNNKSIRYYIEALPGNFANGYRNFPNASNTETFTPGRGYLAYMWEASPSFPKVVNQDITGTVVQGDFTYDPSLLTFTSTGGGIANDGWNLLGNPYPSSIRWEDLTDLPGGWTTTTNIDPTVFVTDNGSGGVFRSYNRATNVGDMPNGIIAAGQAFWLKANAPSPAITLTELAKSSTTGTFYRKRQETAKHLVVSLSHKGVTDNSFVVLHDGASKQFDPELDAYKLRPRLLELQGPEFDIAIVGQQDAQLVMYAVKDFLPDDQIKLAVRTNKPGEYAISFSNLQDFPYSNNLFLIDSYLNRSIKVQADLSYSFQLAKEGILSDRFYLSFKEISESVSVQRSALVVAPNPVAGNLQIFVESDITPQVTLWDILGRPLEQVPLTIAEYGYKGEIDMTSRPLGIYFIKANLGNKVISERVLKN